MFLNHSAEIWGVCQKLPEKLRKRGYNFYTYMIPEPSITSRDRALITLHISGRASRAYSGKMRTHDTVFPEPEEKKRKEKKKKRKGIGVIIMFPR